MARALRLSIAGWNLTQRIGVCDKELTGDDADLCGIAELVEELFAVFPDEAKGLFASHTDSGQEIANNRWLIKIEFPV